MSLLYQHTEIPDTDLNLQINDFDRRFAGTYMYRNLETGKKDTVYVRRIRGYEIHLQTGEGNIIAIDGRKNDNLLELCLPKTGYYNLDNGCVFVTKKPSRQWKRSFCANFYQVLQPNKDTHRPFDANWYDVGGAALDPVYVNMNDISHPLFTNVAISRMFAVAVHKKNNFLLYRRCPIGLLDYNSYTIKLQHKVMEQEIKDLLKRTGVTRWKLEVM